MIDESARVLACGHPIRGKVVFLGGPLHFLPSLRQRFIETLKLGPKDVIIPEQANIFVALGASRIGRRGAVIEYDDLLKRMESYGEDAKTEVPRLAPLFTSEGEYEQFLADHRLQAKRRDISTYSGRAFLGIDAGSTTTKAVLMSQDREILLDYYGSNEGKPLEKTIEILRDIESKLPSSVTIANACVTGYGEGLIQKALDVDEGEIETSIAEFDDFAQRRHRKHHAQRSLLFWMRIFYRDFRQIARTYTAIFRTRSPLRTKSRRLGHAMHRLHEFSRETGPKRRR